MSILSPVQLVLAHPRSDSHDHRLAERVSAVLRQAGARQIVHDLYAESFDPVLTEREAITGEVWTRGTSAEQVTTRAGGTPDPLIDRHRRELADAAALVVIHPDWWGKPPAILAGWLDRVLLAGRDQESTQRPPAPRLKRVLVINTSDQEQDRAGPEHDPLGMLWRDQIGPFLGSPELERLCFRPVGTAGPDTLARWNNACDRAAAWACGAAR